MVAGTVYGHGRSTPDLIIDRRLSVRSSSALARAPDHCIDRRLSIPTDVRRKQVIGSTI